MSRQRRVACQFAEIVKSQIRKSRVAVLFAHVVVT
jgi:hypothetical protein